MLMGFAGLMALVAAGDANAALPAVILLLSRVTGSGAELLLIEAKLKEIGGLPLSRIYFSAVLMPHAVLCQDKEGRYLQKIQSQRMSCSGTIALRCPSGRRLRRSQFSARMMNVILKICKMKKKAAMISKVTPRLVERHPAIK